MDTVQKGCHPAGLWAVKLREGGEQIMDATLWRSIVEGE